MKTGGGKMSHQAWLERKDRQKREEIARDAAKMKREQQEKENRAAGNNALKFSKWLAVKDKYERAVSLLGRLNAGFEAAKMPDLRVHNVDQWKAIGVAMCAVDCALILLHREDKSGGDRYSKLKKLGQLQKLGSRRLQLAPHHLLQFEVQFRKLLSQRVKT